MARWGWWCWCGQRLWFWSIGVIAIACTTTTHAGLDSGKRWALSNIVHRPYQCNPSYILQQIYMWWLSSVSYPGLVSSNKEMIVMTAIVCPCVHIQYLHILYIHVYWTGWTVFMCIGLGLCTIIYSDWNWWNSHSAFCPWILGVALGEQLTVSWNDGWILMHCISLSIGRWPTCTFDKVTLTCRCFVSRVFIINSQNQLSC